MSMFMLWMGNAEGYINGMKEVQFVACWNKHEQQKDTRNKVSWQSQCVFYGFVVLLLCICCTCCTYSVVCLFLMRYCVHMMLCPCCMCVTMYIQSCVHVHMQYYVHIVLCACWICGVFFIQCCMCVVCAMLCTPWSMC